MKRTLDLIVSTTALALLSPILLFVALAVRTTMGKPMLFRQLRAGKDRIPFYLYKFRSMSNATDQSGNLLPDSRRLTRLGNLLRKTSIDELPSLINVLKGEMSIVGPRPLLCSYVPKYSKVHLRRLDVKPGITGWAQINGRQSLTFSKRFELDLWYIDNQTVWLDAKIMLLTVNKVLRSEGFKSTQNIKEVDDLGLSD